MARIVCVVVALSAASACIEEPANDVSGSPWVAAEPQTSDRSEVERSRPGDRLDPTLYPGARVLQSGRVAPSDVPFRPDARVAERDLKANSGCAMRSTAPQDGPPISCTFGPADADLHIVIVGGSHMGYWRAAFNSAADNLGVRFTTLIRNGCRFSNPPLPRESDQCSTWIAMVVDILTSNPPDAIITGGTFTGLGSKEVVPRGYVNIWRTLADNGVSVIGIRDTPRLDFSPVECVTQHGPTSTTCTRKASKTLARVAPSLRVDLSGIDFHHVDMTPWICPENRCTMVIGNVLVWRDDHHISDTYATTLAPMLTKTLRPVVRALRK
jgi:hypothetical protein